MNSDVEIKVAIPRRLLAIIQRNIAGSSYATVEDYIRYLVIENVDDSQALSSGDEEMIRKRLSSLGYE